MNLILQDTGITASFLRAASSGMAKAGADAIETGKDAKAAMAIARQRATKSGMRPTTGMARA